MSRATHPDAAIDAEWWGARNGGVDTRPPAGSGSPAALWTRETSSAAAAESLGSSPTSRRASMVLLAPGGPTSNRW